MDRLKIVLIFKNVFAFDGKQINQSEFNQKTILIIQNIVFVAFIIEVAKVLLIKFKTLIPLYIFNANKRDANDLSE